MEQEKRRWPRVPYTVRAVMEVNGERLEAGCENVSMNGMLAASEQGLPVGTLGAVRIFQDLDEEQLLVFASFKVMRLSRKQDLFYMGVSLFDIDADSSINLYNIIRHNFRD